MLQVETILRHCHVFSEVEYREQAPEGDDVFFCRSLYDESLHRFVPREQHEYEEGRLRGDADWGEGEESADEGQEAWTLAEGGLDDGWDDAAGPSVARLGRQGRGRGRRGPGRGGSLRGGSRGRGRSSSGRGRGKRARGALDLGWGRPLPPLAPELLHLPAHASLGARAHPRAAAMCPGEESEPFSAQEALRGLHLSSVPAALPCREKYVPSAECKCCTTAFWAALSCTACAPGAS